MSLLDSIKEKVMKYMGPMTLDRRTVYVDLEDPQIMGRINDAQYDEDAIYLTGVFGGESFTVRVSFEEVTVKLGNPDDPLANEV